MPDSTMSLVNAALLSSRWSNKTVAGETQRLKTDQNYRTAVVVRLREVADRLESVPQPSAPQPDAAPETNPANTSADVVVEEGIVSN